MERRRSERRQLYFPVQLDAEQLRARLAVSKDVSSKGCLLSTQAHFEPGSRVAVVFRVPGEATDRRVEGTVVRFEPNADDPRGLWPQRAAIEFDDEVPELEEALVQADSMRRIPRSG